MEGNCSNGGRSPRVKRASTTAGDRPCRIWWRCGESASRLRRSAFARRADARLPRRLRTGHRPVRLTALPCTEFDSPLCTRKRVTAAMHRNPLIRHGGGAENRTPVQSSPLTGVSRLSHRFGLRRRTPDGSRLASQLVQSFPRAYQLRPLEHLPRMTRPRRWEQSPVQRLRFN